MGTLAVDATVPEVPLLVGASDSGEVDVQGRSLLDSEDVSAPDRVLVKPVSTPRMVCSAPGLPKKEIASGDL